MDLSTHYLGLELKHPLMPGASPMVDDLDTVKRLEDAGASATAWRRTTTSRRALPLTARCAPIPPWPRWPHSPRTRASRSPRLVARAVRGPRYS
jgi:hypothetical protein